jgi:hypothetical protein
MSHRARTIPTYFAFPLTAALLTGALLATFGHALAGEGDRGEGEGGYYYDRYALPYVKRYAPPDTAPGTFDEHPNSTNVPKDSGDQD